MASFLVRACIYIAMFGVCWYALGAWDYAKTLKQNHVFQAQLLYFLLCAALAYGSGSFVLSLFYLR